VNLASRPGPVHGGHGRRVPPKPRVLYTGVGLALGCGIGAAVGALFGPTGLVVGAGVGNAGGLVVGAAVDWRLHRIDSATRARSDDL
jgi:hypothetical protein